MRKIIMGVVAGMLLPLYPAQANIQTDLKAGLPLTDVIQNAITEVSSVDKILSKLLVNCKPEADIVTCKAGSAESIISAAASSFSDDTEALQTIGQMGLDAGLTEEELTQIALNNGIDPTAILPVTAAGNPQGQGQGLNIAPGQTGNPVTPPPFGSNAGGGGGGNASPSA
ncbi:hypothetical protein [Amphritea japonica]|uniref:Uncharacterized protein n=1 Tax=Amphritea japonica ATCC BAA-1530 TaxID=1278309 RepID=A0A7R6P3W3_9GAMM|nr:hypothetical protein [Amphritea japonica]BBB25449.1 conserved hypothetical protein [Amphritea japonica ATCC BAA-1530]